MYWRTGEENGERAEISGKVEESFLPPSHDPPRALFSLSLSLFRSLCGEESAVTTCMVLKSRVTLKQLQAFRTFRMFPHGQMSVGLDPC